MPHYKPHMSKIITDRLLGTEFTPTVHVAICGTAPKEIRALAQQIATGLPESDRWGFAHDIANATKRHPNLTMVWPKFGYWLLTEELAPHAASRDDCAKIVNDVAAMYRDWIRTGERPSKSRATAAAAAANAAAANAANAAYAHATYAATYAAATYAAAAAAAAAYAAANATYATAANAACYQRMAAQFLKIIEEQRAIPKRSAA